MSFKKKLNPREVQILKECIIFAPCFLHALQGWESCHFIVDT